MWPGKGEAKRGRKERKGHTDRERDRLKDGDKERQGRGMYTRCKQKEECGEVKKQQTAVHRQ